MGKFLLFLFVLVLLLGGAGVGGWFYAQKLFTEPGPATADNSARVVIIDPKSSVTAIAAKLLAAGAVRNDLVFRGAVRVADAARKLKAGEYAIPSGASVKQVIAQLEEGRVLLHGVTAPEGLTSAMIMDKLKEEAILAGSLPAVEPAEGVLLPDTYMVPRGEKRADVVAKMITAQQKLLAELWPNRQAGLPFDTPEQAVILASIVEKETGLAEERPLVAAVFVNRLRKGMKLESDPTIIYGLTKGAPLGHGLLQSEMSQKNPWSTYQIEGLPPTPICNPGREAIKAVLNPPASDALYFVASGIDGHSVFSATYAEHVKNVANLRAVEKKSAQAAASSAPASASAGQTKPPGLEASTPPPPKPASSKPKDGPPPPVSKGS